MIDIERLNELLARGAAVSAAARHASAAAYEGEVAVRQAQSELTEAEAAAKRYRGTPAGKKTMEARAAVALTTHRALEKNIPRLREVHLEMQRRAGRWARYCETLRALAKKHGVVL